MLKYSTQQLQQLVNQANNILIIIPPNHNLDHLAAALSLHLSLTRAGKHVQSYSPTEITVEFNKLIAIDKITNQLSGKNLVISLPNDQGRIERVYTVTNPQTGQIEIIIEHKENSQLIDHQAIDFKFHGGSADLVLVVDRIEVNDLNQEVQNIIANSELVYITNRSHPEANSFEEIRSSISENIYHFLEQINYKIDQDTATNLLAGIEYQTRGLSHNNVSPNTFETVAACLRLGAVRSYVQTHTEAQARQEKKTEEPLPATEEVENKVQTMETEPVFQGSITQPELSTEKVISNGHASPSLISGQEIPDWLTPKIFNKPSPAV